MVAWLNFPLTTRRSTTTSTSESVQPPIGEPDVRPPSIVKQLPVTKPASPDARYTRVQRCRPAYPCDRRVRCRCLGSRAAGSSARSKAASARAVMIQPGLIALHRTP